MWPAFDLWWTGSAAADVAACTRASAGLLAARRAARLSALLAHAARGSAWVRGWLAGRDPDQVPLDQWPVMHKAEMMANFDAWVTDPALTRPALRAWLDDPANVGQSFLGRYVVWESSGSQGTPGLFVQDAHALAVYDALEALRRPQRHSLGRLLDPFGVTDRVAFVGASGGHFASVVSIERLRRLNPWLADRLQVVSFLQPLAAIVDALEAIGPNVLAAYPSMAAILAAQAGAGRLRLPLREVWTGGETLTPAVRAQIAQGFGCPVSDSYGASEFLALASECAHGGLHLNADWVILEPVDAQGQPVPPGVPGARVLLTNLANHVQPLIRYALDDCVTLLAHGCACGSSLPLLQVQGRGDETVHLRDAAGATASLSPLAVCTLIEEEAGLFDFQLLQRGPAELLLRSGARGAAAQAQLRRARAALARFLQAQGVSGVRIGLHTGAPARAGRTGKLLRVQGLDPSQAPQGSCARA